MDNKQPPQTHSMADYRQKLIQTLTLILEREREWLAQMESQPGENIKPLIDYMDDHLSIISYSLGALTAGRYGLLLPNNEEAAVMICRDIASYIDFSLASHERLCTGLNHGLVAKGITTVKLQPVNR